MANSNNRLKAYVRYDGSGRVIAGSLILQRFKPKVGNWQEINANECCNYVLPANCIQFVVNTTDGSLGFTVFVNSTTAEFNYTVTWGDGTTSEGTSGEGSATIEHIYASQTSYTVTLCFDDPTVITSIDFPGND
jgi:oxalate decarboxylase/phosphoglucose isomerase-like protein (cupin superfamily)